MRLYEDRRVGGFPRYILSPDPVGLDVVPHEILKSVVFLCADHEHSPVVEPTPRGTGFFLRYLERGVSHVYIVTARHCIDGIRNDQRKLQRGDLVQLRVNVRAGGRCHIATSGADWVYHPGDQPVDVAVLPFDPNAVPSMDVDFSPLQAVGQMSFPDGGAPANVTGVPEAPLRQRYGPGDEVVIPGLFRNHYGHERNTPILRMGNIAAMPSEPVMVKWPDKSQEQPMDALLVDTRSIRGLSGSPVYVHLPDESRQSWDDRGPRNEVRSSVVLGSSYYLIGLVHGHFNVPLPDIDYATEENAAGGMTANAGVCLVVPVAKILETFQQPKLAEMRREERERHWTGYGSTEADG